MWLDAERDSSFVIDSENDWVEVLWRGTITPERALEVCERVTQTPGWRPDMSRIMTYTPEASFGEMQTDAVETLLSHLKALFGVAFADRKTRVAHVCADPLMKSYVLYWAALLDEHTESASEFFTDRDEAITWIRDARGSGR